MTQATPATVPVWRQLVLAAVVAVSTWISIDLTRVEGGVASVFIGNGLMVGVLLLRPASSWPLALVLCTVAAVAARLLHGDAWPSALGRSAANLLEVGIVLALVRRTVDDVRDPAQMVALSRSAMLGALLGCAVSSAVVAAIVMREPEVEVGVTALAWFTAHLLGMVVVGTLTVVALRLGVRLLGRPGEGLALTARLGVLALACALVFVQSRYPLLFLVFLPLLWIAFRHGFAGVVLGVVMVAIASGTAAALGHGPFALVTDATVFERTLLLQLFIGACCALALPVALSLTERRRLQAQVRHNEQRYRLLASHARDLVVRMRADGQRLYVSPSAMDLLGWAPEELMQPRWELVHEADRARLAAELGRLLRDGGDARISFRIRHRAGHHVWIEALAARVDGEDGYEIIYSGRDVSERVAAERALADSQGRLQAVTDSIPALIAHLDRRQRYTFVNAYFSTVLKRPRASLIGASLGEVWGEVLARALRPHFEAALRGELRRFEGDTAIGSRHVYFRTDFVPDEGDDGMIRGVYALSFDITALKQAEQALERLARVDALTGLANRRQFEERLTVAVTRARRHQLTLALLSLDVDRFKGINDTFGHAAGDQVLKAVAQRLQAAVYDVDLVARLGGDEFVILIEDAGSPEIALLVARRIVAAMKEPIALESQTLAVTTSIGVGFTRWVETEEALLELADAALYDAKRAGRNTFALREV